MTTSSGEKYIFSREHADGYFRLIIITMAGVPLLFFSRISILAEMKRSLSKLRDYIDRTEQKPG